MTAAAGRGRRPVRVTTFRIGDPPRRGEGLRIGAARYPPRGVPRSRWQTEDLFDVWLPMVAPSAALLRRLRPTLDRPAGWTRFARAYARELERPPARAVVDLLAALAARTPIAVGCDCADETRCHRRLLQRAIAARRPTPSA